MCACMLALARQLFVMEVIECHLLGYLLLHLLISQIVLHRKSSAAETQCLVIPSLLTGRLHA